MRGSPPKGKEAGCNRVKRRLCEELKGRAGRKEEEEEEEEEGRGRGDREGKGEEL
jgi:hypothetical protein